jgi:hypothetical protein
MSRSTDTAGKVRASSQAGLGRDERAYDPDEEAWFRSPRDERGHEFDPETGALIVPRS